MNILQKFWKNVTTKRNELKPVLADVLDYYDFLTTDEFESMLLSNDFSDMSREYILNLAYGEDE